MPREPWIKVKIGFRRSGKVAALPSDTARLGWLYALIEAKTQRRMGVFDSKSHFVEVLGRFGRWFDAYVEQDLLEIAPQLCRECKPRNPGVRRGEIVIHDYLKEQRDPSNADRQAIYRETHGTADEPDGDAEVTPHVTGTVTASITPNVTETAVIPQPSAESSSDPGLARPGASARTRTGTRTGETDPPQTAPPSTNRNGESAPTVTADSRARATTATATATSTERTGTSTSDVRARNGRGTRSTGPTRVGDIAADLQERSQDWKLALTERERDEWSTFGPEWDAFKVAWLEHGFRHPPAGSAEDDPDAPNPSQRALLWSVLDAWPNDVARWIAETPKRASASQVVAAVITRWHGKRDEAEEREARQDAEVEATRELDSTPPEDPRVVSWIESLG